MCRAILAVVMVTDQSIQNPFFIPDEAQGVREPPENYRLSLNPPSLSQEVLHLYDGGGLNDPLLESPVARRVCLFLSMPHKRPADAVLRMSFRVRNMTSMRYVHPDIYSYEADGVEYPELG